MSPPMLSEHGRINNISRPHDTHDSAAMSAPLEGKVVLITGGARRVGAAISRRLHGAGANLIVHYRSSSDDARSMKNELMDARADSVVLVQGDLLKPANLA